MALSSSWLGVEIATPSFGTVIFKLQNILLVKVLKKCALTQVWNMCAEVIPTEWTWRAIGFHI